MSNLANNVVVVNNAEILVKEWNGERVITFKEVDRSHGRCKGTARARFNKHRDKFINGVDYYATTRKELNKELEVFGIRNSNQGNPNIEMILLTKSGYLMLVKTFNDPEAWRVQRDLINAYFVLENMFEQKGRKSNDAIVKSNVNENNLPAQQKTEVPAVTPAVIHSDISIEIKNFLEYEQKKNEEFRETMMKGFAVLSTLIMNQNKMFEDYLKQIVSVSDSIPNSISTQLSSINNENKEENKTEENAKSIKDSAPKVVETTHKKFSVWKNDIMELIGNRNRNFVLSETYSYMTKHYGICWTQLEKDYSKANGCKPHNTLFLAWWMEKTNKICKNLTYSCVETVIKNIFKTEPKVVTEKVVVEDKVVTKLSDIMPKIKFNSNENKLYPVNNTEELKKLAEYLVKAIGDNSPHGVVFYRKFFRFVAATEKIDWKSFEEKYRNEFNKHSVYFRVSNLMMIEHFKEVEQKCVNLFNKYVEENYTEFLKDVK